MAQNTLSVRKLHSHIESFVTSLSIFDLVDFYQFVVVSTYVVSFFFGELPPGKGSGD